MSSTNDNERDCECGMGGGGGGRVDKPQAIGQQLHKFDSFEIEYNLISLNHQHPPQAMKTNKESNRRVCARL